MPSNPNRGPAGSKKPAAVPGPRPATVPDQLGRYRIVKLLGQGGMGSVYLAQDTQLDRPVALKVPHIGSADSVSLDRFYREVRLAATLSHPNLCPVYDTGSCDGVPYLAMAYIEGRPLSAMLRSGRLTSRQIANALRLVALAVHEAHQHGIIHRDLKPANIMINQRGEPIVMDFGLARQPESEEMRLTMAGCIVGTPAYMSPEQLSASDQLTPRTDVYSLGVVLYEALAGRLPFEGPVAAILGQVLTVEPTPPSALRATVDPALEAICLKAMAKQPEERFVSMTEFAAALSEYLKTGSTTLALLPPGAAAGAGDSSAPTLVPEGAATTPVRRRRTNLEKEPSSPWGWIIAAVLLVGVLAGGGALWHLGFFKGKAGHGTVVIHIDEAGAEVIVDGRKLTISKAGTTDPVRLDLDEGNHQLMVVKIGFDTFTQQFRLAPGTTETIHVQLQKATPPAPVIPKDRAALVLEIDQAAADVAIDGKLALFVTPAAKTPFTIDLAPGMHELIIHKAGFRPHVQQIACTAGMSTTIKVSLQAVPAAVVLLHVDQPAAEVSLDGKVVVAATGAANTEVRLEMSDGTHQLKVAKQKFVVYNQPIKVEEGKTITIRVRLEPMK